MVYQTANFAQFAKENQCQRIPILIYIKQHEQLYRDTYFQVWIYERIGKTNIFQVVIEDGNNNVLERFKSKVPGVTFDELKIWCVDSIIMFPEDY